MFVFSGCLQTLSYRPALVRGTEPFLPTVVFLQWEDPFFRAALPWWGPLDGAMVVAFGGLVWAPVTMVRLGWVWILLTCLVSSMAEHQ